MARHRRRAPLARRSLAAPLACGTAVLAVSSGAFAVAAPQHTGLSLAPTPAGAGLAALAVPAGSGPSAGSGLSAGSGPSAALRPVSSEPRVADVAALVKAVQGAERRAAEEAAADGAALDKAGGDKAGGDKAAGVGATADKAAAERAATKKKATAPSTARSAAGTGAGCGLSTSGLGPVAAHVRSAAQFLGCRFGKPTMYGVAGRAGTSDHPSGHAVDFMVDPATGNALADCALRNRQSLGITYVIWQQRINFGSGWQPMEDRGGVTANHFDHVHVSFATSAGRGPIGC